MTEMQSIQWFPGHMSKTRRLIKENLTKVDAVVELLDSRIPISSRNPEIDKLILNKPRLILLNKYDLSNENINNQWKNYFQDKGIPVVMAESKSGKGLQNLRPAVEQALVDELNRRKARGMEGKPIRLMIVGIPNVGKSSLLNRLCGSRRAKVEDRPGVTRGNQWAITKTGLEILDTAGVLWPKFEDQKVGENLAITGAIKDDIIDIELLAMRLLRILNDNYYDMLNARYNLGDTTGLDDFDLLELVAKKRGMLLPGGHVNTERAAIALVDEFRAGKIGKISLEKPSDIK